MRWRSPTRAQALFLTIVCVLTAVGAALIVYVGTRGPSSDASPRASVTATRTPRSDLPAIAFTDLPAPARDTLGLVDRGGPLPYRQDGAVFNNAERLLPHRDRGYYHEYTVPTPGSDDRGVHRLVVGADGDVYYTADHYESFRQVLR